MQNAVFNRPARDRACASSTAKLAQPHVEASLPVCQPFLRPQWHSETTAFRDGLCRNECVFQIAIAPGPSKPRHLGRNASRRWNSTAISHRRASPALWARRWRCHFELGRRSWSSRHRSNRYEGPSPLPEAAVQQAQLADRAGATCVERIGGSGDNRRAHD